MTSDEKWMRRALALARRGQGAVHPNPMVGAVLVKNSRVVGEGYHRAFGQAHAEVDALRRAGPKARGATLYVTLEPCSHFGKTPPCARAVVEAGIDRVVAAMRDPNPLVAGKGLSALRRADIAVSVGEQRIEAEYLNRAFITWVTRRRPFVTVKMATSIDGKMATDRGESKWITSPAARQAGHVLRAEVDAIAVGIETALRDDPSLTAHGQGRDPIRVLFDQRLRLPLALQMARRNSKTIVFTGTHVSAAKRLRLEAQGLLIHSVPRAGKYLSLPEALKRLAQDGVTHLLVEGGARLQTSFFEQDLVDEVVSFVAPVWIGTSKRLSDAPRFNAFRVQSVGPDAVLRTLRQGD